MPDNHATFESDTASTAAVLALATKPGPGSNGVHGITSSPADSGVYGEHSGRGIGVFGRGGPAGGEGVFGQTANASSGVYGKNTAGGAGVTGESTTGDGVSGKSTAGFGVSGTSSQSHGVHGLSFGAGASGVSGANFSQASRDANGVTGFSVEGTGVAGQSTNIKALGIFGSNLGGGFAAAFDSYIAVNTGVYADSVYAFLSVATKTLQVDMITPTKPTGTVGFPAPVFMAELFCPLKFFRIDHPADPAGKYLSHACVESSEMKTVYDGIAVLDEDGQAVVRLPQWFDALNGDVRYQLTPLGAAAPELHIAEKISGNQFRIGGGPAGLEVSWQVTGVRKDKVARASPLVVEQDKPANGRGRYLHPELYGESQDRSLYPSPDSAAASRAEQARSDRFEQGKKLIAAQQRSLAAYRQGAEEHARSAGGPRK
jgi:hypothetical protein